MILTDNRNYLRIHNRTLLEKLAEKEVQCGEKSVAVELSKKGLPTLKVNMDGKIQYIHSKYDPEKEAELLVKQIEDMNEYENILFIGVGLGYHIKELLKQFPKKNFSIFEPNIDVLYEFLSIQNLTELPVNNLVKIFSTIDEQQLFSEIAILNQSLKGQTYIFTLPVYENLYAMEVKTVVDSFLKMLKDKRNKLVVDYSFQKRWTINSIKNFPEILKTPNILHDIDTEAFVRKPAIIVAAGPSLNEEFENLKYIKEKGLAYIFSVGSAINALIEQGIYPDAACTYDPTEENQFVFEKLLERNITNIPLVFGSSVGFETLENYPGVMLHMLTNQDTIAPNLINDSENINIVFDEPSIAVITFQLLKMLGCSQIIFVGQNLGFQNNLHYAEGINYDFVKNEISEQDQISLLTVKDVYDNDMKTNEDYNRMRQQLELYINLSDNIEVINTTKGGAKIEGTEFIPLSQVIADKLKNINNVSSNWYVAENKYDFTYSLERINSIQLTRENLEKAINNEVSVLREINLAVKINKTRDLEKKFNRLDKELKKILFNPFYKVFIEPMLRVHFKRLTEEILAIRFEADSLKKGRVIAHSFAGYLIDCQEHINFVQPLLQELKEHIQELNNQTKNKVEK